MIRNKIFVGPLCLGLVMTLVLLFAVSCRKKEEKEPAGPVSEQLYSTQSIYAKVKQQVKENPENAGAFYHLADLYFRNRLYEKAIDAYKQVVRLRPGRGYSYLKMGMAYSQLDRPEEAVQAYIKAVESLPRNPLVYNNLGIVYGKLGRIDEEIGALQRAIELRPRYASARFNLGLVYLKRGDKQAARRQYEALQDIDGHLAGELLKRLQNAL